MTDSEELSIRSALGNLQTAQLKIFDAFAFVDGVNGFDEEAESLSQLKKSAEANWERLRLRAEKLAKEAGRVANDEFRGR